MIDIQVFARQYLTDLKHCLDALPLKAVEEIACRISQTLRTDHTVMVIGNGGSAATASHMVCDFTKTVLGHDTAGSRRRFRVMALADNLPTFSAWANDVGYQCVFSEQIKTWAEPGDLVIAISASGNSTNIVDAVRVARDMGAHTIGILGFEGGQVRDLVDECVVVPSDSYGQIEDVHMIVTHLITAYLQQVPAPAESRYLDQLP